MKKKAIEERALQKKKETLRITHIPTALSLRLLFLRVQKAVVDKETICEGYQE